MDVHHHMIFVHTFRHVPTFAHYLFSVEQKNVTQGLRTLLSDEGGRYMASEKQVSNNLSNSVLKRIGEKKQSIPRQNKRAKFAIQMFPAQRHRAGRLTYSGHGCS